MKKLLFVFMLSVLTLGLVWGQVNIAAGSTITESFNSLGTSATATLPTGWKADKNNSIRQVGTYSGAVTSTEKLGGNAMTNNAANGIYNFGAGPEATATDRGIGGLSSANASKSVNVYVQLKNNGATAINSFNISYNVEKYRNGSNSAGFTIQMYYSTDGSTWTSAGDDFKTSFAADANLNGFTPAPGATTSVTNKALAQSLAAGSNLYLAWNYSVTTGTTTSNAQALGIDDVSITAVGGSTPIPPVITNISPNPATDITPTTSVHVSATITDADGVVEMAELNWGFSAGNLIYLINMSKGANDVWTTVSPIPAQAAGTTVYYSITAMDDDSNDTESDVMNYTPQAPQPQLNQNVSTLSGFAYTVGKGPSAPNSFKLTGSALTGNVMVSAAAHYEISLAANAGYTSTGLELEIVDGALAETTIYVRLKAGLSIGEYNSEAIEIHTGSIEKTVICSGAVRPAPLPDYLVNFEDATKTTYASGTVTLGNLDWNMTEALIGDLEADFKNGTKSARFSGKTGSSITMLQDKEDGLGAISFQYRRYGTDAQVTWIVECSTDQGLSWDMIGDEFTASATVQYFYEELGISGKVRVRIRTEATGSSNKRLNIDDILLTHYADIPESVPTVIAPGVSITSDTDLNQYVPNEGQNAIIAALPNIANLNSSVVTVLSGAGNNVTLTFDISTPGIWYGMLYVGGTWIHGTPFPLTVPAPGTITFSGVNFGAKGDIILLLGEGNDPTLPVELSSFLVNMNSQNQAVLTWISQSETELSGYYILRNTDEDLATAVQISNLIPAANSSTTYSYTYVDSELSDYGSYYYWLQINNLDGSVGYHGPIKLVYGAPTDPELPPVVQQTELKRIYPNPFNPNTNIAYYLAKGANVNLKIYNHRGQMVRSFNEGYKEAGDYRLNWNGKDDKGMALSTGVYFFRLEAGKKVFIQKAVLMK